jgi:uncharacterized protein (TIGR03083 family)
VEIDVHIAALEREGQCLAETAARLGLDVRIPTCPRWRMRTLVRHVGGVHRWATSFVDGSRTEPYDPFPRLRRHWPADDALVDWFRAGHLALVDALRAAPADLSTFAFLRAPSALAFWARRQAHETAIHRADAQSPTGAIEPYEPAFARDGLDELLLGFLGRRRSRPHAPTATSLHLHATDGGEWLIRMAADDATITNEHAEADCVVAGPASELYLLAWNRRPAQGLAVDGDPAVLDHWRRTVQIHWA